MNKITIPVSGMHCKSCEMILEDELSKVSGVEKSKADHRNSVVEIYYDSKKPNISGLEDIIRKTGYVIGKNEEKMISRNGKGYKDLLIAFLVFLGAYFVFRIPGLSDLNFTSAFSNSGNIRVIFLVGLTAGVSSCMALVGGLVLGISARHAEKHPGATSVQKFSPHLYFNLGRISGFVILGGFLGMLGSVLEFSSSALGLITILVGIVMLFLGLQLLEIFPVLDGMKFTLPKSVGRIFGMKKHEKKYSHLNSMIVGALTFFLPCGFTQAAQVIAVGTGSFFSGALVMGIFVLGTVPGLLGIGGLASVVKGALARRFFKFAGFVVISFALFNAVNGYNLLKLNASDAVQKTDTSNVPQITSIDPNVTIENGVQVVKMNEKSNGYSPNKFTIKKGVPVKWVINAQEPYSCAASLVMPKYNIKKQLTKGNNVIEFTPTESGTIKFSCSMGMYTGTFNVVD